jgi:nitrite reductase/ring-hydroxylating ferredoxin subunit
VQPGLSFEQIDRATLGVDPELELAVTYNRVVAASLTRIWENVFDWQHLPVLHDTYCNHVELMEIGVAGWRVKLTKQPGDPDRLLDLELRIDKANTRYRVRTLAGDGTGTEIWTLLKPLSPDSTQIEVRYYLPEKRPEKRDMLGAKYRGSCQRLWDEDEAIMQQRERLANARRDRRPGPALPIALGKLDALLPRLPLVVDVETGSFRIVEVEGRLHAHSTVCPHWLGPLDVAVEDGCIRCPWHGFLFDVRSGESADGRDLRLAPAPPVLVDPMTGDVTLAPITANALAR